MHITSVIQVVFDDGVGTLNFVDGVVHREGRGTTSRGSGLAYTVLRPALFRELIDGGRNKVGVGGGVGAVNDALIRGGLCIEKGGEATSLPIGEAQLDSADSVLGVQCSHSRQVGCITHHTCQGTRGEGTRGGGTNGHGLILSSVVLASGNVEIGTLHVPEFAIGSVTADISGGPTN